MTLINGKTSLSSAVGMGSVDDFIEPSLEILREEKTDLNNISSLKNCFSSQ